MRTGKRFVLGALAGTFALALATTGALAAPPEGGPDRSEPNLSREAGGNPLGDASLAVLRQRAVAKEKAKKEMALKTAPPAPAPARAPAPVPPSPPAVQ